MAEPRLQGMGFWQCWAMSVGVMIGSGVFLLPAVLAPYGIVGFLGWLVTSVGVLLLAICLARLARRQPEPGGPYAYARHAFGDVVGFLVAWGYWLSLVFAVTAISVAFAGYLGALLPTLNTIPGGPIFAAGAAIWVMTAINLRGVGGAATVQLVLTVLKIVPLLIIVVLGLIHGSTQNLPAFNPSGDSVLSGISGAALLTMWAFIGIEAAVVPAGDVRNPDSTIPRAVVAAAITVALLYILVNLSVSLLLPAEVLQGSQAPLVEAARVAGPWGALLIGIAALVSTVGSLNGNILLTGQIPSAVAGDGLAPRRLAVVNAGRSPYVAIVLSVVLSSALLIFNLRDDLVGAFSFLISMSTLAVLAPYALCAVIELRTSWKSARGWAGVALLAVGYTLLAIAGSGVSALAWGAVMYLMGLPVYALALRFKTRSD